MSSTYKKKRKKKEYFIRIQKKPSHTNIYRHIIQWYVYIAVDTLYSFFFFFLHTRSLWTATINDIRERGGGGSNKYSCRNDKEGDGRSSILSGRVVGRKWLYYKYTGRHGAGWPIKQERWARISRTRDPIKTHIIYYIIRLMFSLRFCIFRLCHHTNYII